MAGASAWGQLQEHQGEIAAVSSTAKNNELLQAFFKEDKMNIVCTRIIIQFSLKK
jgi:hypothetical protein